MPNSTNHLKRANRAIDYIIESLKKNDLKVYSIEKRSLISMLYSAPNHFRSEIADLISPAHLGLIVSALNNVLFAVDFNEAKIPNAIKMYEGVQDLLNKNLRAGSDLRIFYSWQSDLPSRANRNFIAEALLKIQKRFKAEANLSILIDRDTRNIPGSPDVINTIFDKIQKCDVFIADVTTIGTLHGKSIPNPNVMLELGYALNSVSANKVIMVFNNAFGQVRDLPFDLGFKRQLQYNINPLDENRGENRKKLADALYHAIQLILKA